jgi:hypothetical protein
MVNNEVVGINALQVELVRWEEQEVHVDDMGSTRWLIGRKNYEAS